MEVVNEWKYLGSLSIISDGKEHCEKAENELVCSQISKGLLFILFLLHRF